MKKEKKVSCDTTDLVDEDEDIEMDFEDETQVLFLLEEDGSISNYININSNQTPEEFGEFLFMMASGELSRAFLENLEKYAIENGLDDFVEEAVVHLKAKLKELVKENQANTIRPRDVLRGMRSN